MGKTIPLKDEEGNNLPKNLAMQFRDVQGGLEHLKTAGENIFIKLKSVGKKLNKNTTDLSEITQKVNSIEATQKSHIKLTNSLIKELGQQNDKINSLISLVIGIHEEVKKQGDDNKETSSHSPN